MTRAQTVLVLALSLLALSVLAGCGAAEPPRAHGGLDLTEFWRDAP